MTRISHKIWRFLLLAALCLTVLAGCGQNPRRVIAPEARDYHRLVIASDIHYPSKTDERKASKREGKISAKDRALEQINSWPDVDLTVFTGDMVQLTGSRKDYNLTTQFISRLNQPKTFIAGNHEIIYEDISPAPTKVVRSSPAVREAHLERYQQYFGPLYYSREMGEYLLVFLSVDDPTSPYSVSLSHQQLDWLARTLEDHKDRPTLIFCHAPLPGTLDKYNKKIGNPNNYVHPYKELHDILMKNPQVLIWVSGHTHTPASEPAFASQTNWYEGKILNLHNPSWETMPVCTNSLYLYPDRIEIRTFDHKAEKWIDKLDRTVKVPEELRQKKEVPADPQNPAEPAKPDKAA